MGVVDGGVLVSSKRAFDIIILADRCKECGLCIHVCPKKILVTGDKQNKKGYRVTTVTKPSLCIGCRLCEFSCPDFVLRIEPSSDGVAKALMVWGDGQVEVITDQS
ncbi:hypothetical protein PYJP_01910 [Pyrofollis japonicus]|nr:hypothetical protein PYJP_01910 [Pyrofollis japonicus]